MVSVVSEEIFNETFFIWTTNHFASSYSFAALLSILADTDRPKVSRLDASRPETNRPKANRSKSSYRRYVARPVASRSKADHRRLIGLRLTGRRPPDKRQIDKWLEGSGLMYLRP